MRLTHVAHLRLPFGRLLGYEVRAIPAPATAPALPVSFDQRRHVGAGDRAGSWMALSLELPGPVPRERLAEAWLAVIARHGTLRSVFVPTDAGTSSAASPGVPRLREATVSGGAWVEHAVAPGAAVNETLRAVLDAACRPYAAPSHRLCVLETATGPTVVIAADHAHVDMWSMLVIARDFLAALDALAAGRPVRLPVAPAFAEHTAALRDRPPAPIGVHRRWREILGACDDLMPRFPLPLGSTESQPERVELRDVLDVDASAAFSAQARAEGVSTLSLAVSAMTAATRELAGMPLRAVFPVHSRTEERWHDAVGWFITNSVIESSEPDPASCAAAVREAVELGSWPLAEILAPWGGMPEAPGMFAISWLDLRRLPVRVDSLGLRAQYVGAAIRTDGVMLWFILDESGLHLRCRYPDTPEARRNVGAWLDRLVGLMRAHADSSAGGVIRIGDAGFRIERAVRDDVPAIAALLGEDADGREPDDATACRYDDAFAALSRDHAHFLAVVRGADGRIVGTMQLTIIPGLVRGGATRLQIEGLRVAGELRSRGLGSAMLAWAHEHGRARGATLAQLVTDEARDRARAFYARHGYASAQVGLQRGL
ncbi:GNAT family N-acetyltransferase [Leucobacter allii]|uniref:GNAT family N-acetyltransferase n=1 Tax=Leucobacter allii TaxID=2932247 RepID=A0ABY4FJQ0_9MICO|nr:GNAT family N-acetyltransferase [Leucobacter allii]UOQ56207.1 GNAT family N-acetyltransferase [Leucobacter allii]